MKKFNWQKLVSLIMALMLFVTNFTFDLAPQKVEAASVSFGSMLARAEAIVNYKWTPSQNISTWNGNYYNGRNYFPAGVTVTGMPYSLFTREVVSDSLLSLSQYKNVASKNYSATRYCYSTGSTRTGPVYGNCCATFVSEVFGGDFMYGSNPRYDSVKGIQTAKEGTTSYVKLRDVKVGDALSNTSATHIIWVGAVSDTGITIYESTPPICQRKYISKTSVNSSGYLLYGVSVYSVCTRSRGFTGGGTTPTPDPGDGFSTSYAGTYFINTNSIPLTMRSGPGTNYGQVTTIPKGTHVHVTKANGTWAHVEWNGKSGYCSMEYLKKVDSGLNLGAKQDLGYTFYATLLIMKDWKTVRLNTGNGNVELYDEQHKANYVWKFMRQGDGSYLIYSLYNGKCLDAQGALAQNGTNVFICDYNGGDNQKWEIYGESGNYKIKSKMGNYFLDVNGGYTSNGTNVQIWEYNGTDAQKFQVYQEPKYFVAPTLTYSQRSDKKYLLSWNDIKGATSYYIAVYKQNSDGTEEKVADDTGNVTSCSFSSTDSGKYRAVIQAKNGLNEVQTSNSVHFTIQTESISVKTKPQKLDYYVGETLNTSGLVINSLNNTGRTKEITSGFSVDTGYLSSAGTKRVTVTYDGKTTYFDIYVKDVVVDSISMRTEPSKKNYYQGESLSTSGLSLTAKMSDGTTKTITSGWGISADLSSAGTKTVTVSYSGKTIYFDIYVKPLEVESISIKTLPNKTTYFLGEDYSSSGLTINVKYNNGSTQVITDGYMAFYSGFTSSGYKTITVAYEGKTTTFNVEVKSLIVSSIEVESKPYKTTYYVGDTLDIRGLELKANINNGTSKTVSSGFSCTPTKLTTSGTKAITVTYKGKTTTFNVEVKSLIVDSISVKIKPYRTAYYVGDTLETRGLILTANINNGTSRSVSVGYSCSVSKLTKAGKQEVKVTYKGKTANFYVEVKPPIVSSISVKSMPYKTTYYVGDKLDSKGLTLVANMNNNTTQTITSGYSCSPTNFITSGTKTITVTYQGKTTTFNVDVKSLIVDSILVKTTPYRTGYYVGDELETRGLILTANINNGTSRSVSTGYTCSISKFTTFGKQQVKVTYKGKTASFYVTVKPLIVDSISVKTRPNKTTYYVGETLNTAGLTLTSHLSNKTSKTVSSGYSCSVSKFTTTGTKVVTVTYKGKKATFNIDVKTKPIVVTKPLKPTNVKAVAVSTDVIKVTWNKVSNADGYEVYRFVNGKSVFYKAFDKNASTFNNAGKLPNTKYQYKMRSYKVVNGEKLYSYFTDLVSCTTPPEIVTKPLKPTNVKAVAVSTDVIKVTWNKVSNADGYEVYRFVNGKSVFYKAFDKNASTFNNAGKLPNTKYQYKMRSYKVVNGEKLYSYFTDLVSCTTPKK